MKPYPWKCSECRERAVSPVTLPCYSTQLDHDGKTYEVSVEDFQVLRCAKCGELEIQDKSSTRLLEALRHEAGLLLPHEIRERRTALGLSQKALATAMKVAESTLSRWETGAQIQQRCMDQFLRVVFNVSEVRAYFKLSPAPQKARAWDFVSYGVSTAGVLNQAEAKPAGVSEVVASSELGAANRVAA
jgi:transcriptional regulator with XRE-family HTH domain